MTHLGALYILSVIDMHNTTNEQGRMEKDHGWIESALLVFGSYRSSGHETCRDDQASMTSCRRN